MTRNTIHALKMLVALAPVVATDNTAQATDIIDTQGYGALEFVIQTGTLADADATFAVTMEHGDTSNLADTAAVTSKDLVGTLADAGFTFAADKATRKVGYRCNKRYVRLTITPTGNAGNAPLAVAAILHPLRQPAA